MKPTNRPAALRENRQGAKSAKLAKFSWFRNALFLVARRERGLDARFPDAVS
jgi:hypothetical protein